MRHLRILGLCVAALLALAALTASAAFAGSKPEWGKCVPVGEGSGKYGDAGCQTKAKGGGFEWKKGSTLPNVPFTGANVGSGGVLTTQFRECRFEKEGESTHFMRTTRAGCKALGGEEHNETTVSVECEAEHNSGEASGKNALVNVSVAFKGCKALGVIPCSNTATEGEIQINQLKGELGYINKAEKSVGVLLTPVTKHGHFASFECGGILGTVVGVGNKKEGANYEPESKGGDGIISPITPVNQMTSKYTQVFTVNPETAQNIPSHFEGKGLSVLEAYTFEVESPTESTDWAASGQEVTNENTASEEGEIKA